MCYSFLCFSPWDEAPYKDATERTTQGNLTLKGFLSEWALMTMLDPRGSLANLLYIGYGGNPASALHVTRRRSVDRKKQQTERNVFHCLVFGPKNAGKSTLLNSFIGRPFSESHEPTAGERYAVNVVDQPGGNKKTLILREIPEDGVKKFLSNKESLSSSDVAVFVYDSSDEYSWKRSNELLVEVARHGEESGYGVPSLIIAAKDDLDPHPRSVQNSVRVCQELGIGASIPVSSKLGDMNNVFCRILSAAEHPHLNIPETVAGREHKQFRQLFNHSLLFMSVGAAFALVGMAALRAYGGRRNSSR
ncbi:RHO FAMILY GTPASE [Salix purpurea]|uniref:RHO FAMILY GTPASE n=1 Tax=Salix purpurea TaxID=77065 RepID=A0A9Q0WW51_SALPP|nr:RHO FAMILY GTPASE [Salix purpurea]KAJ6773899.1 RHO FAMILY GTPASE [Salix purpurea]